jgi:hypothetical protein
MEEEKEEKKILFYTNSLIFIKIYQNQKPLKENKKFYCRQSCMEGTRQTGPLWGPFYNAGRSFQNASGCNGYILMTGKFSHQKN